MRIFFNKIELFAFTNKHQYTKDKTQKFICQQSNHCLVLEVAILVLEKYLSEALKTDFFTKRNFSFFFLSAEIMLCVDVGKLMFWLVLTGGEPTASYGRSMARARLLGKKYTETQTARKN